MHPDFPRDPATITIGVIALLAGVIGFIGFAGNPLIGALLLFLLVAIPLLVIEWLGFVIWERFGGRGV